MKSGNVDIVLEPVVRSNYKKLFSMQAVVGLGRALAKVSLVGLLTWRGLLEI